MYKIAIFASGSGSNALKIIKHFADSEVAKIALIITNRKEAGVLGHAEANHIKSEYIPASVWKERPRGVTKLLSNADIDFIVLAGFLLKVPEILVNQYYQRMINIHPALLPKYGGKGMYGQNVHQAVKRNGEKESGITIHYVNNVYDDGMVVFQARTALSEIDTPGTIQKKVLQLEHKWFPVIIEQEIAKLQEKGK